MDKLHRLGEGAEKQERRVGLEERLWIHEIHKGNKECLEMIAEKYYDDIYRFCCYRTGDREISYDLAQETFCRFIRYVESYKSRNLKGYLLTIAMNVCRDYYSGLRDWQAHEEEWKESVEERAEGRELEPESSVLKADRSERLFHLLKKLPDMQREAIILHYYYDMKFREIARLTGVSTATAKSRVKQGMGKLRENLPKEGFYEDY